MNLFFRRLFQISAVIASATAAQAEPISVTYAPPAQTIPLGSTFVPWDSLSSRTTAGGLSRAVFDAPTPTLEKLEVHITTLNPGKASHPPHHHPWEEMILIKEGKLEVSINGQKHPAGPGALIFFASHDVHNLTNTGDAPATYYVMVFVTAAVHTVRNQPAAEWAPADKHPSFVIDCDSLPALATTTGSRRDVIDAPTLTFIRLGSHITTLNPGQGMPLHARDVGDELFFIKSGLVEGTANGIACRLAAGSLCYLAPNDERSFKNIGKVPASYQVIKVVSDKTPSKR